MTKWLGWDDSRYNVATRYWRYLFPTLDTFRKYIPNLLQGKSWTDRWNITDILLENVKDAMRPFHDLIKDEQELQNNIDQYDFLREQEAIIHQIRDGLVRELRKM